MISLEADGQREGDKLHSLDHAEGRSSTQAKPLAAWCRRDVV